MDVDENEEETIYHYYTIINDGNSLVQNSEEDPIVLVTFKNENETQDNTNQIEVESDDNKSQELDEPAPSFLSNLKLITFEDGRMFVTASNPDEENLKTVEPHLISTITNELNLKHEDESDLNDEKDANSADDTEYQEIELEDGSIALVGVNFLQPVPNVEKRGIYVKHQCTYKDCGKVYTTAHHLRVHTRSHTGCRPYRCVEPGCDKAFSTGYSLKAHVRTHTGEKPYGCRLCSKHFKTSGDLQKHVRIHTGEKPFKCPIENCGRSFTTSNIRKVHVRSHTGERPYSCKHPNCGKAFASATNYKNHMRIHSGEKPYQCQVQGCGRRFTEYSSLYKHNAVHQPYKPYICTYCGQQCKQESTLKAHKRAIHNIVITEDGTEIMVTQPDQNLPSLVLEVSNNDGEEGDYLFLQDDTEANI